MNKALVALLAGLGLGAIAPAHAGGAFTGRAGLTGGSYKFQDEYTDKAGALGPPGAIYRTEQTSGLFGLLGGTTVTLDRLFGDFSIEFEKYSKQRDLDGDGAEDDDVFRSDSVLTLGAYLGDSWLVFLGARHATFGDGFFSDTGGNAEDGPFVGAGYSMKTNKKWALGASLAFNALTLKVNGQPVDDVDLAGLSAKVQVNRLGSPHSFFLRWQHFKGDSSSASAAYQYTEDYLNLGYQATFDFASW